MKLLILVLFGVASVSVVGEVETLMYKIFNFPYFSLIGTMRKMWTLKVFR